MTFLFSLGKYYGALCLAAIIFYTARRDLNEQKLRRLNACLFFGFLAFSLGKIVVWYLVQYLTWRGNPSSQYLLPPYQPIQYFLSYVWFRVARPEVVSLAVALFFLAMFFLLQRLSKNRIFYADELYSAGLAFLANQWPQNFFLIPLALVLGLILSGFRSLFPKRLAAANLFVSLRLLWPVLGLVMLWLGDWLVALMNLGSLRL